MNSEQIIEKLRTLVPDVIPIMRDLEKEFHPNPIGINSLLSGIGFVIAEKFDQIKEPAMVFDLIEAGMRDGDDNLKDAIATGFIEAIISKSDEYPNRWNGILPYLGEFSEKYASGWIKFTETGEM